MAACGSSNAPPTSPSPGGTTPPPVTANVAPSLDAPGADEQLATIRPTLRVRNGTSSQTGAKTYEFQVSDRSDFGSGSATSAYYAVSFGRAGVGEGGSTTSVEVDQDLQPATRFYWRARWVQGSTTGDWSSTFTFRTQVIGYNRPGELYDPLVNGASVAEALTAGADVRRWQGTSPSGHQCVRAIPARRSRFGPASSPSTSRASPTTRCRRPATPGKLKILSMDDNPSNHYTSDYLFNLQYRGFNGNPDHAISFKVLMGEDVEERKLEPDFGQRSAGIRMLNSANTYHWKATYGNFIRVTVQDGGIGGVNGSGSGAGGATIYDNGQSSPFSYQPSPQFAYLGVNNNVEDTGSWPATYRNVWIGNKPRPTTLGSALAPR